MWDSDWSVLDTPWHFYFQAYLFLPVLARLLLLVGPSIVALKLHGRHARWLWRTLLTLPHGRVMLVNLCVGLIVPLILGLVVRLMVEPFGSGWDAHNYLPAALLGAFLFLHLSWDLRHVWRSRRMVQVVIRQDVGRLMGHAERLQGYADRLYRWTHPEEGMDLGRGKRLLGLGLKWGGRALPALGLARRVTEMPHRMVRRWTVTTLARGLIFHLSPPAVLYLLFELW